jgi:hypothetical protein
VRSVARISMMATPVLIAIGAYLFDNYLTAQKAAWDAQSSLNERLVERLNGLDTRLITIEVERRMEDRFERRNRGRSSQPMSVPREAMPPPE